MTADRKIDSVDHNCSHLNNQERQLQTEDKHHLESICVDMTMKNNISHTQNSNIRDQVAQSVAAISWL